MLSVYPAALLGILLYLLLNKAEQEFKECFSFIQVPNPTFGRSVRADNKQWLLNTTLRHGESSCSIPVIAYVKPLWAKLPMCWISEESWMIFSAVPMSPAPHSHFCLIRWTEQWMLLTNHKSAPYQLWSLFVFHIISYKNRCFSKWQKHEFLIYWDHF